ncbi:hypothetical protein BD560DRAFT_429679 [Blakeslea trispora]|nr:hypothetical protein BD560DRAFT_429679 [Blakeslea trispora]
MPFQNPIVESIHDSCVQMERKIDNLETQMTFMTSNLQGSTSSADNFSHMPEIIESPQRAFSIVSNQTTHKNKKPLQNMNFLSRIILNLYLMSKCQLLHKANQLRFSDN